LFDLCQPGTFNARSGIFHYAPSAFLLITAANIVTPTAVNQGAIAASLKDLIVAMVGADYAQIRVAAEILIRCCDPLHLLCCPLTLRLFHVPIIFILTR
jgi:coenzyme F420-reducing hydrogenase alpha subunit